LTTIRFAVERPAEPRIPAPVRLPVIRVSFLSAAAVEASSSTSRSQSPLAPVNVIVAGRLAAIYIRSDAYQV